MGVHVPDKKKCNRDQVSVQMLIGQPKWVPVGAKMDEVGPKTVQVGSKLALIVPSLL